MKRYPVFSAALVMIFFLGTAPAAAQTVSLADATQSDSSVTRSPVATEHDADSPVVQPGFPALRKPMPALVYPAKAMQFGIEGRVLVEYTVNKRGRARDVRIVRGPGFGCNMEVQRVLRAARFQPILDAEGHPVEARFLSAFDFRLD